MEFTLTTTINAPAEKIYTAWLNSKAHTEMTGGEALVSNLVGGTFTAWNGYIEGKNIALEANKRIVQSWRTSQFEAQEEDSQIEVLFREIDGQTEITLIHTKLSDNGEHYKKGWENHYFEPMKAYFSV